MMTITMNRKLIMGFCVGVIVAFVAVWHGCGSDPTGRCLFNHMVGEMQIDPDMIPGTGNTEAEVTVRVFLVGDGCREPLEGATVEIFSSRNIRDDTVDIIQQPAGPTDQDGIAVAYLGSHGCGGEAHITATADGAFLCESWEGNQCTPLVQTVSFYMACNSGESNCGCVCIDLVTDVENCGSCGNACDFPNASAYCEDSVCEIGSCDIRWGDCNSDPSDGCEIDLSSDSENCGICGHICQPAYRCLGGSCENGGCYSPQVQCGPECVNPNTSNEHCGRCDNSCDVANGFVCQDGECSCFLGEECLAGVCSDLNTDESNCGTCGNACRDDQYCDNGICSCPAGHEECSGVCVDLQYDPENCGYCGFECDICDTCLGGVCLTADCFPPTEICMITEHWCECADLLSDNNHCGQCNNQCDVPNGFICQNGACDCLPDWTDCVGYCVDTSSDPENCGTCNNPCAAGESCIDGVCQ